MREFDLTFAHLGLAVHEPQDALLFLRASGYEAGETIFDPEQNVNLILCTSPLMPDVELIYPGEGPGPVDKILDRAGPGVYHLCYTAPDPAASIEKMEAVGLRVFCVSPPKPAVLFGGRCVSFYNVVGFGLIELLED